MNTKYFLLSLCLSALTLSSCVSDDDNNTTGGNTSTTTTTSSIKYSLVGTWKTSIPNSYANKSAWETIHISVNGELKYGYIQKAELANYEYNEKNNTYYMRDDYTIWGYYTPSANAYWAYDEATNTISMYDNEGSAAFSYKVNMNDDKNSWAGIDAQGKTVSFIRIDD